MARAHTDRVKGDEEPPELVPAAIADCTTGYLAAFGTMRFLRAPDRLNATPPCWQLPRQPKANARPVWLSAA